MPPVHSAGPALKSYMHFLTMTKIIDHTTTFEIIDFYLFVD